MHFGRALPVVCLLACGKADPAGAPTTTTPPKPSAPTLDGKELALTWCKLGEPLDVAQSRLYVTPKGALYIVGHDSVVRPVVPGGGPCGLVLGAPIPPPITFDADLAPITANAEAPRANGACQSDGLTTFPELFAIGGRKLLVRGEGANALDIEDRSQTPCKRTLFSATLPTELYSVAANPNQVLVRIRSEDVDARFTMWRYRPDGTLIDKTFGLDKDIARGDLRDSRFVTPCADGVCAMRDNALEIYDALGRSVAVWRYTMTREKVGETVVTNATTETDEQYAAWIDSGAPGSSILHVHDAIEVGDALYALFAYPTDDNKLMEDLVRLDGVYKK